MALKLHVGGALIFAGTSVGASMIALPLVCYKLGLANSMLLMLLISILMTIAAFIITDICIEKNHVMSISSLARRYFGLPGYFAMAICQTLLFFSLLSAYLTGMGQIIKYNFLIHYDFLPQSLITFIIAIFFGFFLLKHTKISDYTNRVLFITKLLVFLFITVMMIDKSNFSIMGEGALTFNTTFESISLLFTAFGFHGSVPMVIKYIGKDDKTKIHNTILAGVIISFIIYSLWLAASFSVLPSHGVFSFEAIVNSSEDNIGLFTTFLENSVNVGILGNAIGLFSFLAIATSFFGVSLGLFDIVQGHTKSWGFSYSRKINLALMLTPALLISLLFPKTFVIALEFAAVTLAVIAVVMPCLIIIKKRGELIYYLPLILGLIIIINEIVNIIM